MKIHNPLLNYYVQYRDPEGHEHYAIHRYCNTNGAVQTMNDLKVPGLQYSTIPKKGSLH